MISKLKTIARVVVTTKNWMKVYLLVFLLKQSVRAAFRNGHTMLVDSQTWHIYLSYTSFFRHFPDGEIAGSVATIHYQSRTLRFDFSEATAPGMLAEFFGKSLPYKISSNDVTKIRGSVIVDIGAGLGDSPVWFAAQGAKKVFAFEPMPKFYAACAKNVALNELNGVCEVFHAGVGGIPGNDFFKEETSRKILGFGSGEAGDCEQAIPVLTLGDIVRRFAVGADAFLKIDCEGYEYDIILSSSVETLRTFKNIMMEYHYGSGKLKLKLEESGFSVRCTRPQYAYQPNAADAFKKMQVGYIFGNRL